MALIMSCKVRSPGPMTVLEAWTIVHPIVQQKDRAAQLWFVTSGLDLSHEGRSFTWEFLFALPTNQTTTRLTLLPAADPEDIDHAPIYLEERSSSTFTHKLNGDRALPKQFRDSPEVVADFTAQGVDFVTGPSDMKLESRLLATGEAVWVTYYWDEQYITHFRE